MPLISMVDPQKCLCLSNLTIGHRTIDQTLSVANCSCLLVHGSGDWYSISITCHLFNESFLWFKSKHSAVEDQTRHGILPIFSHK